MKTTTINELYESFLKANNTTKELDNTSVNKERICIADLINTDDYFASFKFNLHNSNAAYKKYYGSNKNAYKVYISLSFKDYLKENLKENIFMFYKKYNKSVSIERFASMLKLFFQVKNIEDYDINDLYNKYIVIKDNAYYLKDSLLKKNIKNNKL